MSRSGLLARTAAVILLGGCSSGEISEDDPSDARDDIAVETGATDSAVDSAPTADVGKEADAVAPTAPPCLPGDRTEWSGTIPKTVVAISVCSACGESYVVAANGSSNPAEVTLDDGTKSIKATVPATGKVTSGRIADKESDGSVTVCGTSDGASGCLPVAPKNQKYCDPFRSITKLRAERIDQGVDYGGAGPIYAIGPGTIDLYRNRTDSGWPGGTFMSYKITAGPAAGKVVYLAENIDLNPKLKSGSYVFNGTVLGTLVNASPDSEIGWGVAGAGYTAEHSCYVEGCSTPLGFNFNALLVCLKTPSGKSTGATTCCPPSSAYPADWCTLLDKWQ